MRLRTQKTLGAAAILAATATAAWASCGGTEGMVSGSAGSLAASATASLASAATALIAADEVQTEVIVSALRVLAKQIETSAEKVAAATVASEQSAAAVAKDLAEKEMIDKIVFDYTSQGFDPCAQSEATRRLAMTEAQVNSSIPGLVRSEIEAGTGKFGSPQESLRQREERHRALFCTQAEVDAGACSSLGKIPGGDTNAALLFSTDVSADARAARNALINQVIGLPDAPLRPEMANSPEGAAYLMEKKRKDAFLAFPAYSLKTIQAETENVKGVMNERVGQYFGTARAEAWARSQTSQSQRGLLVDLVKIQGINLKIAERRLRQNMRVEANLAGLLEMENQQRNGAQTETFMRQVAVTAATAGRKVNP